MTDLINLRAGSPGDSALKACSRILLEATQSVLHQTADATDIFTYGPDGGDFAFRDQVAKFLTNEYNDQVEPQSIMMNAGATQGLSLILSVLVPKDSPVFVVDPSYFMAVSLIRDDLQRTLVPVPSDDNGPIMSQMEELVKSYYKGRCDYTQPFWAAVYLIPHFNNPTGQSYSKELCQQLVSLARSYNLMLVTEDVYNLVTFTDRKDVPRRLLTYDRAPGERNHVVSNCSFSKIMAPGLRLGWIEASEDIVTILSDCMMSASGGAFNHYTGKLVTEILRCGKQTEHLAWLRVEYKRRLDSMCQVLDDEAPNEWSYVKPKGGLFVWIKLGQNVDASDFQKFCEKNCRVTFLSGVNTSPSGGYKNCIRLAISYNDEDILCAAVKAICQAYPEFLRLQAE